VLNDIIRMAFSLFAIFGLPTNDPTLVVAVGLLIAIPLFILVIFVVLDFVHRLTSRRYYLRCMDCQYTGYSHELLARCPRCGGSVTYPRSGRILPASNPGPPPGDQLSEDKFYGGH